MLWCSTCHRMFHSWDKDRGHWCPPVEEYTSKDVSEWDPELPPVEGWQTEPPPPLPDKRNASDIRESWWFWGCKKDRTERGFELVIVENVLLGSGDAAMQRINYRFEFEHPRNLKGYWKKIEKPFPLPPIPDLPKEI